jgi:carboxyl-terminal processing protease
MFYQQAPKPVKTGPGAAAINDPLAGLADIQDVLAHIRVNYVDVPDMGKVLAGGIQGALERANILNSYLTHGETQLPDPGSGETGLTLIKDRLFAIVIGVVPGSPAAKAGLQVGDGIRKMDGESLGSMSHWTMERKLRGPVGSEVTLVRMASGSSELKNAVLKREKLQRPTIESRIDHRAIMVMLPDITEGRAKELNNLLKTTNTALPLVVDLRKCNGGSYDEAAKVASLLGCDGVFATLQETGHPDRPLNILSPEKLVFKKIAVLTGLGTVGSAETLAVALKHLGDRPDNDTPETSKAVPTVIILGDRTIGQAVERRRFPLKQGGAVEIVTRRWLGCGGEPLDKMGPMPDYTLRGIPASEDILPRILKKKKKGPTKPKGESRRVASTAQYQTSYPITT